MHAANQGVSLNSVGILATHSKEWVDISEMLLKNQVVQKGNLVVTTVTIMIIVIQVNNRDD